MPDVLAAGRARQPRESPDPLRPPVPYVCPFRCADYGPGGKFQKTRGDACTDYFRTDRRFTYTTPKTYLEFLALYNKLLAQQAQNSVDAIERLQSGLTKLKETAETVVVIEAELKRLLERRAQLLEALRVARQGAGGL